MVVVVMLLGSGGSISIRNTAFGVVGGAAGQVGWSQAGVAAVYTAFVWLLLEVVLLPVHVFRGYVLERRYALSEVDGFQWCRAHVATVGLSLMLAVSTAVVVSTALRLWPSTWWLVCAATFTTVSVGLTALAPLSAIPWLYRVSPLAAEAPRAGV